MNVNCVGILHWILYSINFRPARNMSDMFYTMSEIDARVRPFVLFVRLWAAEAGITAQSQPSPKFTNFMVTCLAIFFLQRLPRPILPPSEKFVTFDVDDKGETMCRIDASSLDFITQNTDSLEQLAVEFFAFYSSFDFASNGISIVTGDVTTNAAYDPIYIVNPVQSFLNAAAIVSNDQCDKFANKCRLSYDALTGMRYNVVQLLKTVR